MIADEENVGKMGGCLLTTLRQRWSRSSMRIKCGRKRKIKKSRWILKGKNSAAVFIVTCRVSSESFLKDIKLTDLDL